MYLNFVLGSCKNKTIFCGLSIFNDLDNNQHTLCCKISFGKRKLFSRMNSIIEVEKANYKNSNCYCHCLSCPSCFYKAWPIFLSEFECSKMNNTVSE